MRRVRVRRGADRLSRGPAAGEHPGHPAGHRHQPAADPAQPAPGLGPPRRDHQRARRAPARPRRSASSAAPTSWPPASGIPQDRHRLPVVYITVPPAATPRMVAMEFARFFGPASAGPREPHRRDQRGLRHRRPHPGGAGSAWTSCTTSTWPPAPEPRSRTIEILRRAAAGHLYLRGHRRGVPTGLFAGARGRRIAGRLTVIPATPVRLRHRAQREQWRGADRHPDSRAAAAPASARQPRPAGGLPLPAQPAA